MIGIIDYGMGNLRSVEKAFLALGARCEVISEPVDPRPLSGLVLPGVGAFAEAMDNLETAGWTEWIRERADSGLPLLGICLGLQLFFSRSEEGVGADGLDIFPGRVVRFPDSVPVVPHMGWNRLEIKKTGGLFSGIADGSFLYFVHSYYPVPEDDKVVAAVTDYGVDFVSAVSSGNIFGLQFHPEKSQSVGLKILKNFVRITESGSSGGVG